MSRGAAASVLARSRCPGRRSKHDAPPALSPDVSKRSQLFAAEFDRWSEERSATDRSAGMPSWAEFFEVWKNTSLFFIERVSPQLRRRDRDRDQQHAALAQSLHLFGDVVAQPLGRLEGGLTRSPELPKIVSAGQAREIFCLRQSDLVPLDGVAILRPSLQSAALVPFYPLAFLRVQALRRWGSRESFDAERARRAAVRARRINRLLTHDGDRGTDWQYWSRAFALQLRPPAVGRGARVPSSESSDEAHTAAVGARAVQTALLANGTITVAKFGAFVATGSGTMLAETLHSLGDTVNQSLVAYGVWRAAKAADAEHPYGYAAEQYVWSLVSAVGLMFVGCGVSVSHGIASLTSPEPLSSPMALWGAMAVCGLSGVVETYSLRVAYEEVGREAAKDGKSVWEYVRHGSDPVNVGVLLEDSVAVGGAAVAMSCLGLCMATGNPAFDALGSIVIGLSIGGVSCMLVAKNRRLLLGQSIDAARLASVRQLLLSERTVLAVHDIKSVAMGPGIARFKAEVAFHPTVLGLVYLQVAALSPPHHPPNDHPDLAR